MKNLEQMSQHLDFVQVTLEAGYLGGHDLATPSVLDHKGFDATVSGTR